MIQINPLQSYIDGGPRAAITSPPSASLVFDLPGRATWVKGVKLKGTDHTYTFNHDNYITLTNTPDSNESEDIKIGVNTSALKSAIDTTYGVVSTTANGLAPKFTSGNKQAATAATTYYFLGWTGSTLKWYQAPFRNIRINSETTDRLGVNSTDPLIISSGNGISVTWDSTNKKIVITNTKPDVNHNTDRTGIKLATVSGTKKTDSTLILANSTTGLNIQGGTNKFLIGDGTNYIEVPVTPSFTVSNKDATIGTALTTIATIAGVDIKAKIASYSLSNHTHSVKINGSTKTIAASGAVDLGNYLPLSGGIMGGTAWIVWSDSGNWGNNNSGVTFPVIRGGLQWSGQSDYVKLFSEETSNDNLNLVLQFGDDNSNGLSIRDKSNVQTSYISAEGVITTKTFKGNLDWSYITNKPSSYTPSAHTHAWNSLTHSSTTENQAILTNGSTNGWKLYTLNISGWNNAANNAHSHSNKSVLDGITSALVNNWNTAYNFVNTISGTDTDKVINKWDEIVNFLAGISEDDKLNTLLNNKLSIQQLSTKDILTTKTNNALFWVNTISTASTITTGPFTDHPYALLSVTNYSQNDINGKFFYRSRLAFSSTGDIKVASCHHENVYKQDETWYNILTSKNSGISGSTIKLNGTSITVYSSSTADGRYVKKSGDTMSGVLTIDTTNFGTLTIKRNDDTNGASIQFRGKSSVYGYIGLNNSSKDKQFLRWNSDTSKIYTILDTSSTYVSSGKGIINGTTITQVDNATNATNSTNATNARKLVNWYSTRPTSLNTQFGDGSLRIFHATASTTEGKSPDDATILHLAWDNNGGWDTQLGISLPSGRVYSRGQNNGTWQSWKTLAFTTDIPTVTNYYWADQKISNNSNAATNPTVALLKATTGVQIGNTADYGWYLYNNRICAGINVARDINTGSLLVSSAWADSSKVPTNGIYSKGNIQTAGGFIKSGSSNSYVLLGAGGHKAIRDFATSGHNHDNRYIRKWYGVHGIANKFLKLKIGDEKGWIRLEISDSNNSLSGGYGIYIVGWGYHGNNSTDNLIVKCLYTNDSRYITALKVIRTSRNNYDFYFQFAAGSSYSSYTITYSNSVTSIDCTVTAITTIPTATWTSSLSALQLNADMLDGYHASAFATSGHTHAYLPLAGGTMTGALNFANNIWNKIGDDSYIGDCNKSGMIGIKAANTTYPGIAFFDNTNTNLGNLIAYSNNIKYRTYSLQFLDNGNTNVSAGTWMNPFSTYNASEVADGQAICVWGQSSYLSNLASDSGNMSLWLKRINANTATLNMVLDGEYYANGNQRLAHISEIPIALKNPYALTISLNGTSQGPYDGSATKNVNITPSSIGAATSGHNHDGRYVYNYGGTQMDGASVNKNALGMTTSSGISGDWWHILQAAWNGEYRWNSQIAFPTQNRNGMYYRSGLDDNTAWGSWIKLLDIGNSYVTGGKGVINGTTITQVDNATNANNANVASKVYGHVGDTGSHELVRCDMNNDQFRIIAGSNGNNNGWAEIATADDGNEPIYVRQYTGVFSSVKRTLTLLDGSGNTIFPGYATAIGFNKSGSSNSYVLLGGGSHKAISDFMLKTDELSNNLTTISKSLTVTQTWMDTGIKNSDLPANGTYIVQVSANNTADSIWSNYWSGIMSWYTGETNDNEADEIILHRAGHAYHHTIYLRTIMTTRSDGRHLRLQIAADTNFSTAVTYTFKFKRVI